MSADRLAEMAAEISSLRTKIVGLEAIVADNEARVANTHGMVAEIERLRARIVEAQDTMADAYMRSQTADARNEEEIKHLRARIVELEALITVGAGTMGTLQQPTPDEPSRFTCNLPPSAPPHDE